MTDSNFPVMITPHLVLDHVRTCCERVAGRVERMSRMDHFLSVCDFVSLHGHAESLVTMKAGQYAVAGEIQTGLYLVQRLAKPGDSDRDKEADMQIHDAPCLVSNSQMVEGIVLNWCPVLE